MKKTISILTLLLSTYTMLGQLTKAQIQVLINTNLATGTNITAIKLRQVQTELNNAIFVNNFLTGDVKEVDVTNAYIAANFTVNGLGINERAGWAICNGNNGTKDRNGLVSLGYGIAYSSMGVNGGEGTHTLINAELPNFKTPLSVTAGTSPDAGGLNCNFDLNTTVSTGSSQPFTNMQPYIVTLFIQKL
jgi:hypothetical protein